MALGSGDHDETIMVTLNVSCTSEEQVARVSESLGRVATGLVLDGCNAAVAFTKLDPPEEGWGHSG
jgi:hypothetical protein